MESFLAAAGPVFIAASARIGFAVAGKVDVSTSTRWVV